MDVRQRTGTLSTRLTAAGRKPVPALLADCPFAGPEPIQALAGRAHVSAPSTTRFVRKPGFGGCPEFQWQPVSELREGRRPPVEPGCRARPASGDFPHGFLGRASETVKLAGEGVSEAKPGRICSMATDD